MTGGKREIGWKRRDAEGQRVQVKAQKTGNRWHFHIRGRKFDDWQLLEEPPLEDWLELLDCVRRRIQRNLVPEVEEDLLKRVIRDHYPEAEL